MDLNGFRVRLSAIADELQAMNVEYDNLPSGSDLCRDMEGHALKLSRERRSIQTAIKNIEEQANHSLQNRL